MRDLVTDTGHGCRKGRRTSHSPTGCARNMLSALPTRPGGRKLPRGRAERSLPLPLLGSRDADEGDSLEHLTSTHEEGRGDPSTRLSQGLNRSSLLPTRQDRAGAQEERKEGPEGDHAASPLPVTRHSLERARSGKPLNQTSVSLRMVFQDMPKGAAGGRLNYLLNK